MRKLLLLVFLLFVVSFSPSLSGANQTDIEKSIRELRKATDQGLPTGTIQSREVPSAPSRPIPIEVSIQEPIEPPPEGYELIPEGYEFVPAIPSKTPKQLKEPTPVEDPIVFDDEFPQLSISPADIEKARLQREADLAPVGTAFTVGNFALEEKKNLDNLGLMYDEGLGVPRDYAEAVKWHRKAADQGNALAQYFLGHMYYKLGNMYYKGKGQGVPEDYAEAVKWFRKAADQGLALAQFYLGVMCDNGLGVPQDYAEAVKWFRKAADQGSALAQFYLGVRYYEGQGVPQDYAESVKWHRKAADQGSAGAQFYLGVRYYEGQGVPQDYVQAHMRFNLAAVRGGNLGADAVKNRDSVAKLMTPQQIAKAQELARNWQPKNSVGK